MLTLPLSEWSIIPHDAQQTGGAVEESIDDAVEMINNQAQHRSNPCRRRLDLTDGRWRVLKLFLDLVKFDRKHVRMSGA